MERHIKPVHANVVEFPPPVTDGQKEWERRLAAQLKAHLPEHQIEAREIADIMSMIINGSEGPRWDRCRLACYILGMFPDDRAAAQRLVSLLCEDGDG